MLHPPPGRPPNHCCFNYLDALGDPGSNSERQHGTCGVLPLDHGAPVDTMKHFKHYILCLQIR